MGWVEGKGRTERKGGGRDGRGGEGKGGEGNRTTAKEGKGKEPPFKMSAYGPGD